MSDDRPTFGSLFAGIGGIDLGLERAGWTGRWQVEYEPFCQHNLGHHWPDVPRYGDITTVDWSAVEPVDLIAGGFPCQPFSNAGRRLGKADDRWLWPEFARAVGALRPRYVLVENVPGLLAGHGGMGAVLGDLAALGYDSEWDCIPASAVGAPHLRYRVWIVAYANGQRGSGAGSLGGRWAEPSNGGPDVAYADRLGPGRTPEVGPPSLAGTHPQGAGAEPHGPGDGAVPDADGWGREVERVGGLQHGIRPSLGDDADGRCRTVPHPDRSDAQGLVEARDDAQDWRISPQRSLGLLGGTGGDRSWPPEPDVGRVAHGIPARVDRLRALGNAVVPQVPEAIGRRILEAEALT